MPALLFALALLAADQPAAADAAPAYPVGAPQDDYGLVAWCYGALGGYVDLHDQVMPEVTRIESTYRRPGSNLQEDLKVYDELQVTSRSNLELFARAIETAEKASIKPISERGAEAVKKGRAGWSAAASMSKARVAQEWMSWALPAVCVPAAERLEARAKLLGVTFDAAETGQAPAEPAAPADAAAPALSGIDALLEPSTDIGSANGTAAEDSQPAP
ncbi:MAG: hypothetical protein ACK4YQ_06845 [Phenylobacterium sp.]|uniref:hypothetical protein n=1 Tax=Phenylobacterium sp. TaxID=1871053 RepID=UPI00391969F5